MRPIDADEFVKEMNERIDAAIKWGTNAIADRDEEIKTRAEQAVATFCEASLTAKKMPTIDAVPVVHGHWDDKRVAFYLKCSECGCCVRAFSGEVFLDYGQEWHYCPNCGANMDEEGDDG